MIFADEKTYNKKKVSLSQNDSSTFWDFKKSTLEFYWKHCNFYILKKLTNAF